MSAKFTCQFTLDSDAWYGDNGGIADYGEQARDVVLKVAERLRNYDNGGTIKDVNGNKIGSWKLR